MSNRKDIMDYNNKNKIIAVMKTEEKNSFKFRP